MEYLQFYIQVFYGGGDQQVTLAGTYCGNSPPGYMEAPAEYLSVTIRLVILSDLTSTTPAFNTTLGGHNISTSTANQTTVPHFTTVGNNTNSTNVTVSTGRCVIVQLLRLY